ncbi:MAG TPA: flagellar hook-associated protein FlgK [Xanthobacteraceae bacterium]|nr:flagellar hook-associated protein FlgK [Xanthobacteraceae bacterium]
MGLNTAISSALTGLHATQVGLSVVANNVANVNTPGYIRKSALLSNTAAGGNGVSVLGIGRELDQMVQTQLRTAVAGVNYAGSISGYYSRLVQIYGAPGAGNSLDTLFNNFTTSLNTLTASPDSTAAQGDVLNQAQVLAQQLNAMSGDVQTMRSQAESGISDAVNRINQLLQDIADVSNQITASSEPDAASAAFLDRRDADIMELAGILDIRVTSLGNGRVSIFTTSGVSLYDGQPSQLSFDAKTALNASMTYSTDPAERGVGTISLTNPNGSTVDLIASNSIRSGSLAALIQMRDVTLVKAQNQLDEIANSLALSLSNKPVSSTPVAGGFNIDLAGLQNGNTISLSYTSGGTPHKVTIVRVDDPSVLPLDNSQTADTGDQVIGIDFSGGMASVVTQLNAAFGSDNITFSNPSGSQLQVVDDGAGNTSDINSLSASVTTTTLQSGDPTLPLFTDGRSIYTGAINAGGDQKTGFASRIAINPAVLSDPSSLVLYSSTTNIGDSTRPDFIYQQLNTAAQLFDPASGIGTQQTAYSGTVADYIQQVISRQGADAQNASQLDEGQQVVLNSLQQRFNDSSGVNIDTEMSNLITLQNAYGANARVLTAIKQMYDMLLQIGN